MRHRGPSRALVRRPRERHRPGRRRDTGRRAARDRHDADEPGARGRRRGPGRLGRARRAQPRPQSRGRAPAGLHYAPDPSSQQACTIGGNVATNAGGPHCLAAGVTSAHVLALDVVLADGSVARLGGLEPDTAGLRPAGLLRRQRGDDGDRDPHRGAPPAEPAVRPHAAARLRVRSTRRPRPSARSSRPGIVPSALEMMDARITRAVEDFVGAGYPRDAEAVLLVELDGLPAGVAAEVDDRRPRSRREHGRAHGARRGRRRPSGRCCGRGGSRRSARSPASRPTTTCTTRWCPARASSRCSGGSTRSPRSRT